MATAAFQILGTIGIDSKAAEKALQDFTKSTQAMAAAANTMAGAAEKAFGEAEKGAKKFTSSAVDLKGTLQALAFGAFAQQVKGFGDNMISAATQMQGFRRSLTAVTGTAKEAESVLKMVAEYAQTTPFENVNLTEIATKFASMKQPIKDNVELSAKLAFIFKKDLVNAGDIVSQANAGVMDSLQRLKEQFGFTISEAQKYGAIVSGGQIVAGEKGSEANDRFMAAIRKFVAAREKGLGGDIFGGDQGLGAAMSNVGDAMFQLFAQLGEAITPDILAISNALQGLIKVFREMSPTMQLVLARMVEFGGIVVTLGVTLGPIIATLTLLPKLLGAIGMAAGGGGGGAAGAAAGAAEGAGAAAGLGAMTAALGASVGVLAIAGGALVAYNIHLDNLNASLREGADAQAKLHNETHGTLIRLSGGAAPGLLSHEANVSMQERLWSEAKTLREDKSKASADMLGTVTMGPGDAQVKMAEQREKQAWELQKVEMRKIMSETLDWFKSIGKTVKENKDDTNRPRPFQELSTAAERMTSLRGMNRGPALPEYTTELGKLVEESNRSLIEAQKAKLKDFLVSDVRMAKDQATKLTAQLIGSKSSGDLQATAKKAGLAPEQAEFAQNIWSGKLNDPNQMKSLVSITKEWIGAKKEMLSIDTDAIHTQEKLAELQHKSTPETRIAAIHAEADAVRQARDQGTMSADEARKQLIQLHTQAEQERRKQADAQRDANIEMKSLYGDDVGSKMDAMKKKLQGLREAGVAEVDLEKMKTAEKQKIYNEDAQHAIDAAQKVADMRAGIQSKESGTKQAGLQERAGRGDAGAYDKMIAEQAAQLQRELAKVDEDAKRRLRSIEIQLKDTSLNPHEREALGAERADLRAGKPQAASKGALQQTFDSGKRGEELQKLRLQSEDRTSGDEAEKTRLQMRQADLVDRMHMAGANQASLQKQLLENLRQQLIITKDLLQAKYDILIAEKADDPAAQEVLRKKLKYEVMDAEKQTLDTAKGITAEMEKQNQLDQQKQNNADPRSDDPNSLFSGVSYSGNASFSEGFGKKHNWSTPGIFGPSANADNRLAARLGVDIAGRKAVVRDASAGNITKQGVGEGTSLADKRNADIAAAGAAADLKGRAKVQAHVEGSVKVEVELKDSNGGTQNKTATVPLSGRGSEKNQVAPLGEKGR